jgi:hypothetical protein
MEIIILDSAYKHGITEESILYCIFHFHNDIVINEPPPKRLLIGFDHLGNAIEVIVIEDDEKNRKVVIHAMKLRKKYYYLLEEGNHGL